MDSLTTSSRKRLLQRRAALLKLITLNRARQDAHEATEERDWPDRSALVTTDALLSQLSAHERAEVREIDAAVRRMELGTWGRCESCGGPIGRQRLMALPEARHCLDCRSRAEAHV